ncbi:MAG: hypothetical protein ABI600_09095 [Luteolibacter sp.]
MKLKIILLYILSIALVSADSKIEHSAIIPKFYQLLFSQEKPTKQDEFDFFGGKSCDAIRISISSNKKVAVHSNSETPIWDYLRNHLEFFSTLHINDATKMRIQATDPVEQVRLYNSTKIAEKKVFVTFPSDIIKQPGASTGVSVGIFTLGEDCYIDIGSTIIVSGTTRVLIGELVGGQ